MYTCVCVPACMRACIYIYINYVNVELEAGLTY